MFTPGSSFATSAINAAHHYHAINAAHQYHAKSSLGCQHLQDMLTMYCMMVFLSPGGG
jgi:hypothetical protein